MDGQVGGNVKLKVKPDVGKFCRTGIFVRAQTVKGWASVDIGQLDAPSLLSWLRSRGGDNAWAENVVGILLGHGHIRDLP